MVDFARPVIVASVTTTVSAGSSHTCAIATGRLYCWGLNDDGQLGDGSRTTRLSPTPTTTLPAAVNSVITGGSHTCGGSNQDPWDYGETTTCWGNNAQGQLGDLRNTPFVFALAAGGSHTCGTDFGSLPALYCWGSNERGQLGIGTSIQFSRTPLRVASFDANGSLAAGGSHTCASLIVGSTSGLFCWGLNDDGQLGDGTTIQRTSPVLVTGVPFSSVTAGGAHTCALTPAGAAYCWGANDHGQLGDATTTKRTNPAVVAGGLTFVSLSAGGRHTCGVTVGGTYCWGANGNGQLGNGTTTDSAVPVRVSGQ
jgi:alpha-tubulin suppressor-like RCC1 family protein